MVSARREVTLPYAMTFLQNGLFLERVRENENSAT